MSKALLIMDMPKQCNKCPCMKTLDNGTYCTQDMENYRYIDFAGSLLGVDKPDWCPLIPEPERVKEVGFIDDFMYKCGWNDCLDALEGKT